MPDSKTRESAESSGSVIAWVLLLLLLTVVGALPFIVGGLNFDKLPQSSPLLPLVFAGIGLIAYAPTLSALVVTGFSAGTGGCRAVLRGAGAWRVGVIWYALALLGPIVLIVLADTLYIVAGGAAPEKWLILPSVAALTSFSALNSCLGPMLAGSLGEEPGWRGFALPRLQDRYGALTASLLIGVLWSTWHLWMVMTPGGLSHLTLSNLVQTYMRLISTSIIYSWMYNSTKGSLFLVMVAHAGHNIAVGLIGMPAERAGAVPVIVAMLYLAVAIAVVLMTGPRTLTRSVVPQPIR